MSHNENDRSADIAFRRRALKINSAIYSRRNGPALLPVLPATGIRVRYGAMTEWLGSETTWRDADARRLGELAAEIRRFGRSRPPEIADLCTWHADRLRELVSQHAALRRLEAGQRIASPWSAGALRDPRLRRRRRGSGSRG